MSDQEIREGERSKAATETVQAKIRAGGQVTYDEAIEMILDHVLAKWPSCDRDEELRALKQQVRSRGLALNKAAHLDPSAINEALAAQAKAALTDDDWRHLRSGG